MYEFDCYVSYLGTKIWICTISARFPNEAIQKAKQLYGYSNFFWEANRVVK